MAELLDKKRAQDVIKRREKELADFKFSVAKLNTRTVICEKCGVIYEKKDVRRDRCWCDYESQDINY